MSIMPGSVTLVEGAGVGDGNRDPKQLMDAISGQQDELAIVLTWLHGRIADLERDNLALRYGDEMG